MQWVAGLFPVFQLHLNKFINSFIYCYTSLVKAEFIPGCVKRTPKSALVNRKQCRVSGDETCLEYAHPFVNVVLDGLEQPLHTFAPHDDFEQGRHAVGLVIVH
jgi:hypothetical protein